MMRGFLIFYCVSRSEVFAKNVLAFAENISVYFFGGQGDSRDSPTSFTALLASNLLAEFSRQIVIQILGFGVTKSLWESRSMSTLDFGTFVQYDIFICECFH
jgi:hypothetical protein